MGDTDWNGENPWKSNRGIDYARPIKVICIGAGINGLHAAIRLPQRIPNLSLTIYEKNPEVGGTWYENRYPGVACDVPAHSYTLVYEPNPEWSEFYASGQEILRYLQRVADKYQVRKYMKFNSKCVGAKWDEDKGKWIVAIEGPDGKFEDECDVLISATGILNNWKWPDIPGLMDFKEVRIHSATWPDDIDLAGKTVAVIGNGSSAIQMIPKLQKIVQRLDAYARGSTWISPPLAGSKVEEHNPGGGNITFEEETIRKFKEDKAHFEQFRREIEHEQHLSYQALLNGSEMAVEGQRQFASNMKQKLTSKPEIYEQLLPNFPPGCRRLTPGPGYLEALVQPNVDFIKTRIKKIHPNGIETEDGKIREVEVIICATGFDVSGNKYLPLLGRDGVNLNEKMLPQAVAYNSFAIDGFPDFFLSAGPNIALANGSLILMFEKVMEYAAKCIKKMQREGIKAMVVKKAAVDDFKEYCDNFFPKTVFATKCRSWYKNNKDEGPVTALWPGSCLHGIMAFENPRWEDYDYVMFHRNRFAYYGDGMTEVERYGGDPASYMDNIDYPPVPAEVNGDQKVSTTMNGTIDLGDAVKTKDTVPAMANGYNPIPSV